MLREELRRRAALQQNVNVSIARLPRVLEQLAPEIFKPFGRTVAKIVQSRTQRPTPFLVPRRVTAGMTTAIANPTTDAVRATTRRAFTMGSRLQVNLMLRREAIEKLTVVRYPKVFAREGIDLVVPNADDQDYIHDKYMNELVPGKFLADTRAGLLAIVDRMKTTDDIGGVILAGTELPLILRDPIYNGIPFLDTTKIHVEAAVDQMLT